MREATLRPQNLGVENAFCIRRSCTDNRPCSMSRSSAADRPGSSCAAFCANAGLRTLLLERENFPREKVCGDCLNPACWPVLRRLQLAEHVRTLPHGKLDRVEFIGIGGRTLACRCRQATKRRSPSSAVSSINFSWRARAKLGAVICEGTHGDGADCPERGDRELDDYGGEQNFRVANPGRGRWSQLDRRAALRFAATQTRRSASRCKLTCRCRTISEIASSCNFCRKDIPVRRRSAMAN